ncbi:MAG: head maturation protease, ClpP-related [Bacteroidota bacterium]|jgi:ATP-dependent protease ClpP protease subunit
MFAVDTQTNEIFLYDDIGPAWMGMIDSASVIAGLKSMEGKRILLRINSPGGSVDEGAAIFNAIMRHSGGVDVAIDGIAASIAGYIAMAGKKVTIAANAKLMIHDPWTIAMGNSTDLRKTADVLDTYAASMLPAYVAKSGKSEEEIKQIMRDETWYGAVDAVAEGFADEVANATSASMQVAEGRFAKTPSALLKKVEAGTRTEAKPRLWDMRVKLANLTRK